MEMGLKKWIDFQNLADCKDFLAGKNASKMPHCATLQSRKVKEEAGTMCEQKIYSNAEPE